MFKVRDISINSGHYNELELVPVNNQYVSRQLELVSVTIPPRTVISQIVCKFDLEIKVMSLWMAISGWTRRLYEQYILR